MLEKTQIMLDVLCVSLQRTVGREPSTKALLMGKALELRQR